METESICSSNNAMDHIFRPYDWSTSVRPFLKFHQSLLESRHFPPTDPFICPLMQVDQGAIPYVLSGANIMCPGLTSKGANMTPGLAVGQVVTVIAEGKEHALAVGVLKMTSEEM